MACRVIRSLSDEGVQPRDPKVKHTMTLIAYIIGHTNTTLLCPISTVIKLVQSDFNIFDHGISFDSVFFAQHALLQKEYPDCSEFVSSLLETNTIPNPTYERIMTSPHDRLLIDIYRALQTHIVITTSVTSLQALV